MPHAALRATSFRAACIQWLIPSALLVCASLLIFAAIMPAAFSTSDGGLLRLCLVAFMVRTFWFHIGLALIPFAIAAAALRMRKSSIIGTALLAWTLVPSLWSLRPRPDVAAQGSALTLMSINLFFGNDDLAAVEASIRHEDPDLILLQEYTPDAAAKLEPLLRDRYPHILDFSREGAFGQAIFSRKPFIGTPDPFPHQNPLNGDPLPPATVAYNQPQIRVVVDVGGREVMIQNTHLPAPVSMQFFRDQRVWMEWLIEQTKAQTRPLIYAGDFNATQHSAELAALREAGLFCALDDAGIGRCTTWPHQRWLKYVPGIRIDQFMARDLICESARTGLDTGSDHLPIVAKFTLAGAR